MENNKNFDSELQAYFGAIKHAIKEEHVSYLKSHPELRQILNDFLSSCLLEQPDDVYEYAKKFFSYFNYHKDIVRHKPLVITGCSGVGKVAIHRLRERLSIYSSPKTPICLS
jgi:guanylate kinase